MSGRASSAGGAAAAPIRTVAAVIRDADGRVLLVRKHGSATFIQPGGKREPGEDALQTLARELREELGVVLRPGSARRLGEFEAEAVNEPGRRVRGEAFVVEVDGTPRPCAEIAELAWVVPRPPFPVPVAPLSAGHIMPALAAWAAGTADQAGAVPAGSGGEMATMDVHPAPPRSRFVTVLAQVSLLVGITWLVLALALLPLAAVAGDVLSTRLAGLPALPPGLSWIAGHGMLLAVACVLAAAAFLASSWGLLRRREWGRLGFIAFLLGVAALNFAGLPLVGQLFDALRTSLPPGLLEGPDGQALAAELEDLRRLSLASTLASAVLFAGLHAWLAWKLCTPAIRAEFGRAGP